MSPIPRPRGHRGLARSVRALFDDPPPRSLPEESDPGGDVAWVSETGRPLAGASGAEPLIEAVEAYLLAGPRANPEAGVALDGAIERARQGPPTTAMADAVEALLRYAPRDEEALERAKALATPGVAALLVRRVSETADEAQRDRLVHGMAELGDGIRDAALEALRTPVVERPVHVGPDPGLVGLLAIMARTTPGMLEELVHDPDWRVVSAVIAVAVNRGGDGALQILTLALAHTHPRVRAQALTALRKLAGGEAGELARGMLGDPDRGVRAEAARTVGALNVPWGVDALVERLAAEHDSGALVACVEALGALRAPAAAPDLVRLSQGPASGEGDMEARLAALNALSGIGTPLARDALGAATEDPVPAVRELASRLLGALATPPADSRSDGSEE